MAHSDDHGIGCANGTGKYIDNPNETIVYLKLTVELNPLFGPYAECNPDPATGIFKCDPKLVGDGNGTHCICSRPGPDCGCANMKHRAVGRDYIFSGNGGGSASCIKHNQSQCDSMCFCHWNTRDGQCAPWGCGNNTEQTTCVTEQCNGGRMCQWHPSFGTRAPLVGGDDTCIDMVCDTQTTETLCENSFGCSWDNDTKGCLQGGGSGGTIVDHWRADLDTAISGHWYSTQKVSEALSLRSDQQLGAVSIADAVLPTWRIARVDAVKHASCVNDAMLHQIHQRNSSCFAGCPGGVKNSTSDCYVRCLFDGLLGNQRSGSLPLGGGLNATGQLLLSAFEHAFEHEAHGGCPELPSSETVNQTADAWSASSSDQLVGVKRMKLYTLTHSNGTMTNGNAADSAGAATILLSMQSSRPVAPGQELYVSENITRVEADINALFGEFTACVANSSTPAQIACAPTWDCRCVPFDGDPSPPHCETLDEGNPCECALWGGCPGDRNNNAGVVSVGWHKISKTHDIDNVASHYSRITTEGNVYSTMQGGECVASETKPDLPTLCSWRQVSVGKTVKRRCLEDLLDQRFRSSWHENNDSSNTAKRDLELQMSEAATAALWEKSFAECPSV